MTFRDYVRQKLCERCKSYTRAFVLLDSDRDGLVTALDIANFLLSRGVDVCEGTQGEIEHWFSDYTDTPWRGVDMTGFVRFLQASPGSSERLAGFRDDGPFKKCRLTPEDIIEIRKTLSSYMCSLGCSFYQFYKLLAGGRGYLYEHQLREALEKEQGHPMTEKEWEAIFQIIKTDKLVDYVSIDELRDFLEARTHPEIIEEEEDLQNVPWAQHSQKQSSFKSSYEHSHTSNCCECKNDSNTDKMLCDQNVASSVKSCRAWEPRDDSDILVPSSSNTVKRIPTIFRLTSAPAQKRVGGGLAQRLDGSDLGVFTLLSEKIQQTGRPADVFRRFDRLRSRICSWRQFSSQVRILYGIELTPERLRDAICNVLGVAGEKGVTYEMFQHFYSPDAAASVYMARTGTGRHSASSAARGERRTFIYGKQNIYGIDNTDDTLDQQSSGTQIRVPRQPDNSQAKSYEQKSPTQTKGANKNKSDSEMSNIVQNNDSPTTKNEQNDSVKSAEQDTESQSKKLLYLAQTAPSIETSNRRSVPLVTRNQVDFSAHSGSNQETKIVSNAEAKASRELYDLREGFITHVARQLQARGAHFVQLLRETFPGQREVSSKDVLWFFRNKIGVSYSPQLIFAACNVVDGYVDVATLGKVFNTAESDKGLTGNKNQQGKQKITMRG